MPVQVLLGIVGFIFFVVVLLVIADRGMKGVSEHSHSPPPN